MQVVVNAATKVYAANGVNKVWETMVRKEDAGDCSSCGRKSSNQRCYFMIMAQSQIATFHFALRAKHESRPCRKTVFDGLRACFVVGLVNKFPARHKCTAARFAPFVRPDTKSLAASRKRPLRGLHEKSGCRRSNCDPLISCQFVSGNARFVSVEAVTPMGRGNGASLRGGLPTGAGAGLAARRRSRPPTMTVFVFRAKRSVAE